MVNTTRECVQETWHHLTPGDIAPDGSYTAVANIGVDSPWFSGHFPNEPVLPGIALLGMVSEIIRRRQTEAGNRVKISRIRKVRFRLPVRPGSTLSLRLSRSDTGNIRIYQFRIALNGETVCTGIMDAEPI